MRGRTGRLGWLGGPQDRPDWLSERHSLRFGCTRGWVQRLLGLHAFSAWGPQAWGLLLPACRSVHTVGLSLPIDLVFLDRDGCVLDVLAGLAPNRCAWRWNAWAVLELPAGYCAVPGWQRQVSSAWRAWKMDA